VTVEGKAVVMNRTRKIGEDEKMEFLDIDTVIGWG